MFNKSFNLTQFVKDIPSLPLRKAAWLSLVGSVNASLYGAADAMAKKLEDAEISPEDFKTLTKREVLALCVGPESDTLAQQKMYQLHLEWREQLKRNTIVSTGRKADDNLGSIAATMAMMTGPQKERELDEDAIEVVEDMGIKLSDKVLAIIKKQRLANDNRFAKLRGPRTGMVEYIIDNIFATSTEGYSDEAYSQLDGGVKEFLCNKMLACLSKIVGTPDRPGTAIMNALTGFKGDSVLGLADHFIAERLHTELSAVITSAATTVIEQVRKPDVHKAPAPVQSDKVTEVLPNGIKLTHAVTAA